jgi:hypothetical protein
LAGFAFGDLRAPPGFIAMFFQPVLVFLLLPWDPMEELDLEVRGLEPLAMILQGSDGKKGGGGMWNSQR